MRKLLTFLLMTSLVSYGTSFAQTSEESLQPRQFTILDGTVTFEIRKFITPFYGISFRIADRNKNMGSGTYFEVRKRDDFYIIDDRRYRNLKDGIKAYFRTQLQQFSNNYYGVKNVLWLDFVKDGGLELFTDILIDVIDDEFLNAPFNDSYG